MKTRTLALALIVLAGIVSFGIFQRQESGPAPKTIYSQVATPYGGERLFGLQDVSGPIHSAYLYEAGLLGTMPADDVDYLLPYGAQELVTLPGFKTDGYVHRYTGFIPGSGTISCWSVVSGGGRFCFLHLSISNVGATRDGLSPPLFPAAPLRTATRKLSGDELTALAAMAQRPADALPTTSVFHGGFVVGRSGWPTDPVYGNGLAGPANAHLCLLLDQAAATWFLAILDGSHKPPKPRVFPKRKWGPKPYKGKSGHLLYQARVWLHHKWLGRYYRERWFAKPHVMRYGFRHGYIYRWIAHPRWKPKVIHR